MNTHRLPDTGGADRRPDRAHQLGRILVELDPAVVTGRHLLAAVEQRGGEVG